jgi:metal transporter CNNM
MFLLYPVAAPIAKLLDKVLGAEDQEGDLYNRGELSALIRIQYEERIANKNKRRKQRQNVTKDSNDNSNNNGSNKNDKGDMPWSLRTVKHHAEKELDEHGVLPQKKKPSNNGKNEDNKDTSNGNDKTEEANDNNNNNGKGKDNNDNNQKLGDVYFQQYAQDDRRPNADLHADEVTMAEGALQMRTKVAMDVYKAKRDVFSVPSDMTMNEENMLYIYSSGYEHCMMFSVLLCCCCLLLTLHYYPLLSLSVVPQIYTHSRL